MSKRSRGNRMPAFKASGALAVVGGKKTPAEQARRFDVRPNQTKVTRAQLLDGSTYIFGADATGEPTVDLGSA